MIPQFSEASLLVWQLAGFEAQAGTYAQIHPEHFFLAICKADDIPVGALRDDGKPELQAQLPVIERQLREVREIFEHAGFDRKTARRQLRALLGQPNDPRPADGIWHRNSDAKWLCDRALRLALAEKADATPCHLLAAFLHPEASFPLLTPLLTDELRAVIER